MHSLGVELKNARMRKGLSLEEVSGITRIPIHRLLEIESDDFGSIDSAFFYRSFAKQFAQCVGLDRIIFDAALEASARQIPEPLMPGQHGSHIRPDVPGLKPKKMHKLKWLLSLGSLAIMLGACSTFYEFWERTRTIPESHKIYTAAPGDAADNAAGLSGSAPASSLEVKLSALENTWLSLTADGKEVFKGTLRADESKTVQGRQTAQVRTRNAGGLEVVFNGRPLGKLGPEGQNRTIVFTRNSYNVLHAQLSLPLAILIRAVE